MLPNLLQSIFGNRKSFAARTWTAYAAFGVMLVAAGFASAEEASRPPVGHHDVDLEATQPGRLVYGFQNGSYTGFHSTAPAASQALPAGSAPIPYHSRDPDTRAETESREWPLPVSAPQPDEIQRRLAHRYGDPVIGRFVQLVSAETALALYRESAQLIDARHLEPSSYQARVQRAMQSLSYAVESPAFLQANRISPREQQVRQFRNALHWLQSKRPVRNSSDAVNMLYWTMDAANRYLGLRPTAVALEFVYGSVDSLDRYSAFEPAENFRAPSAGLEELEGQIVGIGVEIKPHDDGVLVVKPLRGGPAAEAGLQPGDVIVSINGRALEGQSLDYAVDLIKGPVGSPLLLGVRREGQTMAPVSLVRRRVTIHSVSDVRMLDGETRVGYIKLDKFAQSSSAEMDEALWSLYRQDMESLIIDLRGNPGGLLTSAIELSNKFLPCGQIVSTRGRTASDQSMEFATYNRTWKIPLVVLVDENSASASEIFAAAIQENRRGIVVGRRSYGKGTVQTHFTLRSVPGNLRLTTARFYSPAGRAMAGAGVAPDVEVEKSPTAAEFLRLSNDRDVLRALEIAANGEVKALATAKAGCRTQHRNSRLPS